MTPEQIEALRVMLDAMVQFTYGPIREDTPYQGLVNLTAAQYRTLEALAAP